MSVADEPTPRKVAIVTGASSGIGRAAAQLLCRRDWSVLATARGEDGDGGIGDELASHNAGTFLPADLRDEAAPQRLVDAALDQGGRLDGLVNNAGVHFLATCPETEPAAFDDLMAVNLRAAFLLARTAIPAMAAGGGGVVVNVASEAGLVAVPGQVAYNVSKAALVMLTRSLAVDHAPEGIRAVSVCPGTTRTPLVEAAIASAPDPAAHERTLASTRPANRLGTVDEIANAIVFAMSDDVRFMTGSELVVDGGYTAV